MTRHVLFILACGVAFAVAGEARAQDTPRLGITMGYPAAVGVIWNVADRFALRPEMTFSGTTSDSSLGDTLGIGTGSSNDGFQIGAGLSGLIYVSRWDELRIYVSPRFSYSRTRTSGYFHWLIVRKYVQVLPDLRIVRRAVFARAPLRCVRRNWTRVHIDEHHAVVDAGSDDFLSGPPRGADHDDRVVADGD